MSVSIDREEWQCFSIRNQHEVKYFMQCAFGLIVIIFCMYQIANSNDDKNVYFSLLSGTLGLFLPSPSMKP